MGVRIYAELLLQVSHRIARARYTETISQRVCVCVCVYILMMKSVYYHTNFMVYSRRQMNEN